MFALITAEVSNCFVIDVPYCKVTSDQGSLNLTRLFLSETRLSRLAIERNELMNDLIEGLLDIYESKAGNDVTERLSRIEMTLRIA